VLNKPNMDMLRNHQHKGTYKATSPGKCWGLLASRKQFLLSRRCVGDSWLLDSDPNRRNLAAMVTVDEL
jgi:hypothetical protein